MFGKGKANPADQTQPGQQQQTTRSVSLSVPTQYVFAVKYRWLIVMFLLGMMSQFVLAVWAPNVWNYFYTVANNFLS